MSNTAKLAIILHMGAVSSKIVKVLKNIVLLPYLETSDIHILPSLASISILHNLKLPTKTEISPILGVYAQDKQINSIEVIIPSCFFFFLAKDQATSHGQIIHVYTTSNMYSPGKESQDYPFTRKSTDARQLSPNLLVVT